MKNYLSDPRFAGLQPFKKKVWLSSPTMHGGEQRWINEAFETNWVTTMGANINEVERMIAEKVGRRYAVGISTGTAGVHMATKLAAEKIYGRPQAGHGTLEGHKAFSADMTFAATANPIAYEGGEAVFIDTEYDTWNMDPIALEKAFEMYPEVKLIVISHLYGTPGKLDEIQDVADRHGALIVEDAAESLGAVYDDRQTGNMGISSVISFNGNKIITGSEGGILLTDNEEDAKTVRKWSTQSREPAPWYQHEEMGYNYRLSNIIAGIIRGQFPYLDEHIEQKKAVYERYKAGLADLPVKMNPFDEKKSQPNFWLSCLLIDEDAMAPHVRGERDYRYTSVSGKSSPQEILDAIAAFNAEGRPIWKPMHLQPIYRPHPFVTRNGLHRQGDKDDLDVGADIFRRGLCLPSDNKMTPEQQDRIIEIIHRCFC